MSSFGDWVPRVRESEFLGKLVCHAVRLDDAPSFWGLKEKLLGPLNFLAELAGAFEMSLFDFSLERRLCWALPSREGHSVGEQLSSYYNLKLRKPVLHYRFLKMLRCCFQTPSLLSRLHLGFVEITLCSFAPLQLKFDKTLCINQYLINPFITSNKLE